VTSVDLTLLSVLGMVNHWGYDDKGLIRVVLMMVLIEHRRL
jgi:hypothetical protein